MCHLISIGWINYFFFRNSSTIFKNDVIFDFRLRVRFGNSADELSKSADQIPQNACKIIDFLNDFVTKIVDRSHFFFFICTI